MLWCIEISCQLLTRIIQNFFDLIIFYVLYTLSDKLSTINLTFIGRQIDSPKHQIIKGRGHWNKFTNVHYINCMDLSFILFQQTTMKTFSVDLESTTFIDHKPIQWKIIRLYSQLDCLLAHANFLWSKKLPKKTYNFMYSSIQKQQQQQWQ